MNMRKHFLVFGLLCLWATRVPAASLVEGGKPVGEFVLRVGDRDVDHTIIWREKPLHLSRLAPGRAVLISARRRRS